MLIRILILVTGLAAAARAAPRIACDAPVFEAGERRTGTRVTHAFVIRNEGDQPLVIGDVKPGCGCTTASLARNELAPGESTTIEATLDLTGRRGRQDKPIQVRSNDPALPSLQLLMRVDSRDDLVLEPEQINLGTLTPGMEVVRTAVLRVVSGGPVRITGLDPFKDVVRASWASDPDQLRHTITVVVPPQTGEGTLFDSVRIRTDNRDTPELTLQVIGSIPAGLTLSAREITLTPSAAPVSRTVTVRAGSHKTFTITSAALDDPAAAVEVLPPTVFGQQVRVSFRSAAPSLAGKDLVIRTDVPGFAEIRVPVRLNPPAPAPVP